MFYFVNSISYGCKLFLNLSTMFHQTQIYRLVAQNLAGWLGNRQLPMLQLFSTSSPHQMKMKVLFNLTLMSLRKFVLQEEGWIQHQINLWTLGLASPLRHIVTYWPSTELSIKRWFCVNKRKNSETGASGRRYRNITLTCGRGYVRWWCVRPQEAGGCETVI